MSKNIDLYLQLHAFGATGMADGVITVCDDGQLEKFDIDDMRWNNQPERETERGSVTIVRPEDTEYPKIGFTGEFWRLIESTGLLSQQFMILCVLDVDLARNFVDIVEKALEACEGSPKFYEGLVTADHTLSACIFSPTDDPAAILERARESFEAFEINEGNDVELYFGAGPSEDVREIDLGYLMDRHLVRARAIWLRLRQQSLPAENEALKKAVRDLLAIATGAVDHQETIDSARSLLE